jgi:hypothetical protein
VGQLFDSDRRAEESALGASSGTLPPESESGSNETFAKISSRVFFLQVFSDQENVNTSSGKNRKENPLPNHCDGEAGGVGIDMGWWGEDLC